MAKTPEKASDYIHPLLSFAAQHIPKNKHQETPLYILCTAGMRILPERYSIFYDINLHNSQEPLMYLAARNVHTAALNNAVTAKKKVLMF